MSGSAMSGGAPAAHTTPLQDAQRNTVGEATLTTTAEGLEVQVTLEGFTAAAAGEHGLHIHQVERCEAPFESAGDHYNPTRAEHGFPSANGPHASDVPNIGVNVDGNARYGFTTNLATLELGNRTLADDYGHPTGYAVLIEGSR